VSLCIYDQFGALAGELIDSKPAVDCAGVPCWKAIGRAPTAPEGPGKGYKYRDPDAAADGIAKLIYKGGSTGSSKVVLKAAGANIPDGIAGALQSSISVTLQIRATGAECLSATLSEVKKSEPEFFKIK